jgi:hypothetical protein
MGKMGKKSKMGKIGKIGKMGKMGKIGEMGKKSGMGEIDEKASLGDLSLSGDVRDLGWEKSFLFLLISFDTKYYLFLYYTNQTPSCSRSHHHGLRGPRRRQSVCFSVEDEA